MWSSEKGRDTSQASQMSQLNPGAQWSDRLQPDHSHISHLDYLGWEWEPHRGSGQVFSHLRPDTGCYTPFSSDSQNLQWVEVWRKKGDVLHVVLPQPLPEGKHLLHAHLGQLSSKHAPLRHGRGEKNEEISQPAKEPQPRADHHSSARRFREQESIAHLQRGLMVLRVKRRVWFRATSKIGDCIIKLSLRWDL